MRKLIAVILTTLSLPALADVYVAKNSGGGEIVLTNRNVNCKKWPSLFDGYSYTSKGKMDFCWAMIDDLVQVVYEDGERRVYKPELFYERKTSQPTPAKGGTQI